MTAQPHPAEQPDDEFDEDVVAGDLEFSGDHAFEVEGTDEGDADPNGIDEPAGRRAGRGPIWTPRNILGVIGAMGGMVGVLMFLSAVLVALFFRSAVATIALLVIGTVFLGGGLALVVLGVALTGGRGARISTRSADEDRER